MYSLVIPVYRNEGSITPLVQTVRQMNEQLKGLLETIFVVDGSPDQSFRRLAESLPDAGFSSRLVLLSRNFGSFAAIRAGLERATGDYFAVMAADLQEPPALILEFFRSLEEGEADVVVGTRQARNDPFLIALSSRLFWFFYRRFVQPETPPGGADVFGCNRSFRDHLLRLTESNSSLIGLLFWLGFKRKSIPYERAKRQHGYSAWTFRRRLRYLSDSAFSFSNSPIRALSWLGASGISFSIVFGLIVLWARLTGHIQVAGYAPVILTIIFFGSLNLLCLGIVGSYIWRTFENTKARPSAIVMREFEYQQTP